MEEIRQLSARSDATTNTMPEMVQIELALAQAATRMEAEKGTSFMMPTPVTVPKPLRRRSGAKVYGLQSDGECKNSKSMISESSKDHESESEGSAHEIQAHVQSVLNLGKR